MKIKYVPIEIKTDRTMVDPKTGMFICLPPLVGTTIEYTYYDEYDRRKQ